MLDIRNDELKTLETNYCDTKIIETLKNGEFTAPSYLHDKIEQAIMVLATLCTPIHFEIQEEAFRVIAHDECPNLINIGRQYKCQVEIQEDTKYHICEIPKATAQDHVSNKLTATAIKIHKDDLAVQRVTILKFEEELYNYSFINLLRSILLLYVQHRCFFVKVFLKKLVQQ
jgi:hypothetical protein